MSIPICLMNNILEQFGGSLTPTEGYKSGKIIEVRSNNVYLVELFNGLQLTIQDVNSDFKVDDMVLLAISEGETNSAFIIKKGSKHIPSSVHFIVANDIN